MIIRYNTKTIRLKKTLLCILLSPVIIFGQWDLNPVNFFPTDDPAFNLSRANVDPDSLSCKAGFYLNYVVNLSTLEVAPITMPSGMLLVPSSTRIRIDMDNDGIWELDYTGDQQVQTVEFDYPEVPTGSQGNHTIHFRIDATYYDLLGATLEEEFHKYYPVLTWPMPDQSWESANGDLLIQIQSQDGILDKPLLIVEGFDVFNHSWPSDLYYQSRTFT
ncbi:MAG: hypothetical protein H8D46_00210, partial [FCB group bacterium]|nr:hypothetical protein [FCB group bacterium]